MENVNNSVVCDEVFEEGCQPSNEEILDYAIRIGIKPDKEPQLLNLAREGLMRALPADWKACFDKASQGIYYYNLISKGSQWEHPLDVEYKQIVERQRAKLQHISDVDESLSLLDSGIRSLPSSSNSTATMMRTSLVPIERLPNKLKPLEMPTSTNRKTAFAAERSQSESHDAFRPISNFDNDAANPKGLQLLGAGSMFLKSNSRKPLNNPSESNVEPKNTATTADTNSSSGGDGSSSTAAATAPANVKGILRDSSLSEVRNRSSDVARQSESDAIDDRKSVRFDLALRSVSLEPDNLAAGQSSDDDGGVDGDGSSRSTDDGDPIAYEDFQTTVPAFVPSADDVDEVDDVAVDGKLTTVQEPSYEADTTNEELKLREQLKCQMNHRLVQFKTNIMLEQKQQENDMRQQMHNELTEYRKHIEITRDETKKLPLQATKEADQLAAEQEANQQAYERERTRIEQHHQQRMCQLSEEFQQHTDEYQAELETRQNLQISNLEQKLKLDFDRRQHEITSAHRAAVDTLQRNHTEIFQDLERDLKSEAELLRAEHANNLASVRAKLELDLEVEKQRMRDSGELRQFEKLRCEKRLLEDKYRCLKEKYVRLKTDVKQRLDRQASGGGHSRRSGQTPTAEIGVDLGKPPTTTNASLQPGTASNKNSFLTASRKRSDSHDAAAHRRAASPSPSRHIDTSADVNNPLPIAAATITASTNEDFSYGGHSMQQPNVANVVVALDETASYSQSDTTVSNNFSHTNASRKYSAARCADNGNNQTNNNHQTPHQRRSNIDDIGHKPFARLKSASTSRLNATAAQVVHFGGGGRQQQQHQQSVVTPMENLRRQLQLLEDLEDQFPESALQLDTTHPYHMRYPFKDTAIGGLAEPQQPPTSTTTVLSSFSSAVSPPPLLPTATTKTAASNNSSELEFFKHRILMERDAVRRAKEGLSAQRTEFRLRQSEIIDGTKRSKAAVRRPQQASVIDDEANKELIDMEVNIHRTRALLGEKVIRLRHLEQSLQRIYDREKVPLPSTAGSVGEPIRQQQQQRQPHQRKHRQPLPAHQQQQHQFQSEDAAGTISDLSSQSSSGFSSTENATSDTMHRADEQLLLLADGTTNATTIDIVQSLGHLNAEIREIWEILSKQHSMQGLPPPPHVPLDWSAASGYTNKTYPQQTIHHQLSTSAQQQHQQPLQPSHFQSSNLNRSSMPPSSQLPVTTTPPTATATTMPSFADRLETYRNFATQRATTVAKPLLLAAGVGAGGNVAPSNSISYTNTLVERTQDLRNWLRQAKQEHEQLGGGVGGGKQTDL